MFHVKQFADEKAMFHVKHPFLDKKKKTKGQNSPYLYSIAGKDVLEFLC